MTSRFRLARRLAGILGVVSISAALVVAGATPAQAETYAPITGSGSTWSQNALDQWRKNVTANYQMTVNYNGTGSSAGRRDFIQGTVDFGVSEIPFQLRPEDNSAPEAPTTGYAYMPIVAGGTAFMYHLTIGGKKVTNLRLGGETVTKIFTGVITNWNDPQIQADNPGLAMPDKAITPVVRSDGSGSSAQFSLWMSKQYPDLWNNFCVSVGRAAPCGLTSQYPVFGAAKAQSGSLGVAGYVSQGYGEGAITYVEYSYAIKSGFPVAKVLNNSGYYIEPTAPSVAVALLQARINTDPASPDYLTQILDGVYNNPDSRTYPLSSYSYMIVPTEVAGIFTAEKGKTLGAFAKYFLCEGQQQADALGYSPLPMNLVLAGFEQIKRIPGSNVADVDINTCNNPTFKPGESPENNQLAVTAPMPAECDKVGPNQCTTGTAGALEDTDVSGSGGGGDSANAPGGDSGAGGGDAAADGGGAAGDAPVYDENGALVSGGGSGVRGVAAATPLALPDTGWGLQQTIMLLAGILLVVAVAVPPLVSRRLKRASPPSQ
ncbi:phosphate ABC transporter substrate-binding protein PstS [Compostimonas suwonensis]|uniref:Phosphate ABC transporter phosphate-binding protein n=1 Tax=Compostimonas suwonensis TaxID=1048394 RepID=A0A2M9C390_9MICO|nr:phosphate ABC transporter substrate-binding protein PstS [Compostimonas suwonensis]PJJ64986.1 phosphate ABC transporter phosphate-binding protein [Compostimonas suwonensis]